jgi:hypothetical protein
MDAANFEAVLGAGVVGHDVEDRHRKLDDAVGDVSLVADAVKAAEKGVAEEAAVGGLAIMSRDTGKIFHG